MSWYSSPLSATTHDLTVLVCPNMNIPYAKHWYEFGSMRRGVKSWEILGEEVINIRAKRCNFVENSQVSKTPRYPIRSIRRNSSQRGKLLDSCEGLPHIYLLPSSYLLPASRSHYLRARCRHIPCASQTTPKPPLRSIRRITGTAVAEPRSQVNAITLIYSRAICPHWNTDPPPLYKVQSWTNLLRCEHLLPAL